MSDWYDEQSITYTRRTDRRFVCRHLRSGDECTVYDARTGRLLVEIRRDDTGMFRPIVYASIGLALSRIFRYRAAVVSLAPFPRIAIVPGLSQCLECALVQVIAMFDLEPTM
jgi:hypothetical protein